MVQNTYVCTLISNAILPSCYLLYEQKIRSEAESFKSYGHTPISTICVRNIKKWVITFLLIAHISIYILHRTSRVYLNKMKANKFNLHIWQYSVWLNYLHTFQNISKHEMKNQLYSNTESYIFFNILYIYIYTVILTCVDLWHVI